MAPVDGSTGVVEDFRHQKFSFGTTLLFTVSTTRFQDQFQSQDYKQNEQYGVGID